MPEDVAGREGPREVCEWIVENPGLVPGVVLERVRAAQREAAEPTEKLEAELKRLTEKHRKCRRHLCVDCAERSIVEAKLHYRRALDRWIEEKYGNTSQKPQEGSTE